MAKTETAKDLLMKIITSAISNPEEAASWFAEDGVFEILEPIRKRRRGIVADPSYFVQSLKVGTERASERAR